MVVFHVDRDASPFAEVVVTEGVVHAVVRRSYAEELCAGHFPGNPLVPGAYLAGLMAEVAATLLGQACAHARLDAIEECAFARPVVPGEPIVVEARPARSGEPRCVEAEVRSGGVRAARARLRFGAAS
ncbi:MAG: hypothetical protein AB1689_05705 [Thermodesulfobacteriota bacterium]